jgi:hypothetical protein
MEMLGVSFRFEAVVFVGVFLAVALVVFLTRRTGGRHEASGDGGGVWDGDGDCDGD